MLLKSRLVLSANAMRLIRFEQGLLFQFGFDRMNAVSVMINIFLHLQKETKPSQVDKHVHTLPVSQCASQFLH